MKVSKTQKLLIFGIILVVIDQIIKILVKTNMTLGEHFDVFGSWFKILFIENEGMAYGLSFGGSMGKIILTSFRILLFIFLFIWIKRLAVRGWKVSENDTYIKVPSGVLMGLTMITAGALGNIIDCIFYGLIFSESTTTMVSVFGGSYAPMLLGKVVDMLYFPLIDTTFPSWLPFIGGQPWRFFQPVFNFADSCVTVGAFYLIIFQGKFFLKEVKSK